MLPRSLTLLVGLAALAGLTGCGDAQPPAGVALTVDGTSIPTSRYDHLVKATESQLDSKGITVDPAKPGGAQRDHDVRAKTITELVAESVLRKMADERHVSVSDQAVSDAIAKTVKQLGGQAALDAKLNAAFQTEDDLRSTIRLGRLRLQLAGADPGFEAAFAQRVQQARATVFVEPCVTSHEYPSCLGSPAPSAS